jgi:hypothetical protein
MEPINAEIRETIPNFNKILPFCANLRVANKVPKVDENLFVPRTKCPGIPDIMYAGIEISPPPPAIESTKPAKKIANKRNIKEKLFKDIRLSTYEKYNNI